MTKHIKFSILVLFVAGMALASCKKVQQDMIVKGVWELKAFYPDTATTNLMNSILPYYSNGGGCCRYKIDFQSDDIVFGYYITYDTFNYVKIGKWQLRKFNKIYVQLDNYVDGEFEIKKSGRKEYTMTSEANYIRAFSPFPLVKDTVPCRIVIERL